MLENIRNAITRLPMYRLGPNLGGHIPSCPRHVRHNAVVVATAVGALNIRQLWTFGGRTRELILVGKYWKYHNSPNNRPTGTKLGWLQPSRFRHVRQNEVATTTAVA